MMEDPRVVVAATDFSPQGDHAVAVAAELARRLGARLCVVHVLERVQYDLSVPHDDDAALRARAQERLDELTRAVAAAAGLTHVEASMPEAGLEASAPWASIVAAAREARADLLVVGTHGRRGIARVVLGSVAENVVRHAGLPVLVVPAATAPPGSPPSG